MSEKILQLILMLLIFISCEKIDENIKSTNKYSTNVDEKLTEQDISEWKYFLELYKIYLKSGDTLQNYPLTSISDKLAHKVAVQKTVAKLGTTPKILSTENLAKGNYQRSLDTTQQEVVEYHQQSVKSNPDAMTEEDLLEIINYQDIHQKQLAEKIRRFNTVTKETKAIILEIEEKLKEIDTTISLELRETEPKIIEMLKKIKRIIEEINKNFKFYSKKLRRDLLIAVEELLQLNVRALSPEVYELLKYIRYINKKDLYNKVE
jgi:hypothetical protein